MSAFTPGPWKAIGGGQSIGIYTDFAETDPISMPLNIATVWRVDQPDSGDWYSNANLVAAAPELLAALQAVYDSPALLEFPVTAELVRTALAKVTGEQT